MPFKTILEATILENQTLGIPREKVEIIARSVYKKAYQEGFADGRRGTISYSSDKAYNDGFNEGFKRGELIGDYYATRP